MKKWKSVKPKCGRCGQLGHKESRCLQQAPSVGAKVAVPASNIEVVPVSNLVSTVEVVGLGSVSAKFVAGPSTSISVAPTIEATVSEHGHLLTAPTVIAMDEIVSTHNSETTSQTTTTFLSSLDQISVTTREATPTLKSATATAATINSSTEAIPTSITITANDEIMLDPKDIIEDVATVTLPSSNAVSTTTFVASSTMETAFSTPPPQLSTVNEGVVGVDFYRSSFEVNGVCTGYENIDTLSQRSRGGRPLKPTQKMQELQWTMVGGRGNRGRGGRGGRGPHN